MSKLKTLEEQLAEHRMKKQVVMDLKRRSEPKADPLKQNTQRLTVTGNVTVHRCLD